MDEVAGYPRRAWMGADGRPLVEEYEITGMAHGVPLSGGGDDPVGQAGAHMLDVGLSSTARIAAFFGIAPEEEVSAARAHRQAETRRAPAAETRRPSAAETWPEAAAGGPQAVIEKALKAAGLMR